MIKSKEDLRFYLQEDAKRNDVKLGIIGYYTHLFEGSENYHVFKYLKCLRYCEYHYNLGHKFRYLFYKIKLGRLGIRYNIQIPINVCGYGLRIMHIAGGGGILLNANKIGNYCGFNSGVLLGNKDKGDAKPTIGDHVAFAPGSKAFGKITIGNNCFVAFNAVVTKDVPNNSIVAGVPAKVIKQREPRS